MSYESIKKRKSIRTFSKQDLREEDINYIRKVINQINYETGPNGIKIKFILLNSILEGNKKPVGTYGIIKNANAYITATIINKNEYLVDLGFMMEKIILLLTDRSIGTCWLGGTFKRQQFYESVEVTNDEIIPVVIPIGYIMDNKSSIEKLMRRYVKAEHRKVWAEMFFYHDFSIILNKDEHSKQIGSLENAFESVRLGPSASNKQPWRLVLNENEKAVHFYIEEHPNYTKKKFGYNIQHIDGGISMYHFKSVAEEAGYEGHFEKLELAINIPIKQYRYIMSYLYE